MAVIERSARVPHSAADMLALINDIEAYPSFLHWCHAARIEKTYGNVVEAALEIGIRGIHKTMRTRNTTHSGGDGRAARIEIEMIEGPLQQLRGAWVLEDSEASGCEVRLSLEYEMHRTPFGMLLRKLFDEIANSQLNAFVRRAERLYGQT